MQQEREKKRQAVVFVSSFHPRGGVFCCSWRDGAGLFFFRGGTGRFVLFSEAGRGGCFFFPRRDGVAFFYYSTGRDGVVFFVFFRGPGRDGCFWRWQFFWRDGAKSLHRPAKGGLNRPASRPCKKGPIKKDPEKVQHFKFVLSRVLLMAYSSILLEYVLDSTYS